MGEIKMITFEAGVEKLCAQWVVDIADSIKRAQDSVAKRTRLLQDKVSKLPVPQKSDPKDLAKIPDRINEILKKENVRLKSLIEVQLITKIDVKSRKLTVPGNKQGGPLAAF